MTRSRWLLYSIVTTVGEELIFVLAAIVVLPRWGLSLPWQAVAGVMVALAGWAVVGYYMGASVIEQKPSLGREAMRDKSGVVVKPLEPLGLVKIEGELWQARSEAAHLDRGEEVIVLAQEGLCLVVEKKKTGRDLC